MVSQPFLYICVGQYTIGMMGLPHKSMTTIFSIYNISYIVTFYNTPLQADGGGSTQSLKQKAVNEVIGSGYFIMDKMIINLNMFYTSMENRFRRKISGTKIITQNGRSRNRWNLKICQ